MTTHTNSQPRRAKRRPTADTCEQVTSLIAHYLNGGLDPELVRVFDKHISECPDCIGFLNTYSKTRQALSSLSYDSVPPSMQDRALEFLRKRTKKL